MTGLRRADRSLQRFAVAHFTDQNDGTMLLMWRSTIQRSALVKRVDAEPPNALNPMGTVDLP
jgi:hypothetical protein